MININLSLLSKQDLELHPDYLNWLSKIIIVDDCYIGQQAVKKRAIESYGGKGFSEFYQVGDDVYYDTLIDEYLLPLTSEVSDQAKKRFINYVKQAYFIPVVAPTLEVFQGMIFKSAPEVEILPSLEYLNDNIDGSGQKLLQQARIVIKELFLKGRCGLFVDTSDFLIDDNIIDKSCVKVVQADQILDFSTSSTASGDKLSYVKFITYESERVGIKADVKVYINYLKLDENGYCKYIRFFYPISADDIEEFSNFDEDESFNYLDSLDSLEIGSESGYHSRSKVVMLKTSAGQNLDFIPFVFAGAVNNDPEFDEIPFSSMAETNIAYFRNSADSEESSKYSGQPTMIVTGLEDEDSLGALAVMNGCNDGKFKLHVGSRSAFFLGEGMDAKYLQTTATDKPDLKCQEKIKELQRLGADLISKNANVTATEVNSQDNKSFTTISLIARNASAAYQKCFDWIMYISNTVSEENNKFELNQDYSIKSIDSQVLTALNNAVTAGNLSIDSMLKYVSDNGLSINIEDETINDAAEELENAKSQNQQYGNFITNQGE